MQQITLPVRVMKLLGIKYLLISNAAGNLNLKWKKGEMMLIDDHINLQPDNPLRGSNFEVFGPRFPDMSQPGAILHREPGWTLPPASTPARVRDLLMHCLTKDRRNRLHDIGDARLALERAIGGQEWLSTGTRASSGSRGLRAALLALGGLALLAGGALVGRGLAGPAARAPRQTFHVSTSVPTKPAFDTLSGIAPDARFVVYRAWPDLGADSLQPGGVLVIRRVD